MKILLKKPSWFTVITILCLVAVTLFAAVGCNKLNIPPETDNNISFTPCQQTELKSRNEFSDKADVEFTGKGVQITHYKFEVTCDFTTVNVTHTFVNGVLNITQQGFPNQAKCICYTDVSYTIDGVSQNEVNVIFINGEQVYCYNENYPKEISFEEYSLIGTSCRVQRTNIGSDKVLVISNNHELENYIQCDDSYPVFDFTKYTLLFACGGGTSGIAAIEKNFQQISISEYSLYVDITRNATAIPQRWSASIKVPKLPQNAVVTLNVNDINNNCEWTELKPVVLTEQLKNDLDIIFSENNELVKNIRGDTLLYAINSKEELSEISHNINTVIDIDFENQSIIWGRFLTSSISNNIASKQLSVCYPSSNYRYEISVDKCTDCWEALGYLYYWAIYPRKINVNNVSLIIGELKN